MKVLLTGASGFVGSHVLDQLRARSIDTCIVVRPSTRLELIADHQDWVEKRKGSLQDPASLRAALTGVSHVIHCAGATKSVTRAGFYEVNQVGTRNLAQVAAQMGIERFIHVSSLAAAGPGTPDLPCREDCTPRPISEYGRSKLAGEIEVQAFFKENSIILRPPAVYGPRDAEFLRLFKAVNGHLLPRPSRQFLSLVYVRDLAQVILACLVHPDAPGKVFNVACEEIVTAAEMGKRIATELNTWTIPLPLPTPLFWPLCLAHQVRSWMTGAASVLSLQKYAELSAPGWVCDPGRINRELQLKCPTLLNKGIPESIAWYRNNQWL